MHASGAQLPRLRVAIQTSVVGFDVDALHGFLCKRLLFNLFFGHSCERAFIHIPLRFILRL